MDCALYLGKRKTDPSRDAITLENFENADFLQDFADWLEIWQISSAKTPYGLTSDTFFTAIHTSRGLRLLADYLLKVKGFKYVLFRSVQSDCLEGRFGTHRQMNGGNYYAATRQFLEAEKIIRMKSLLKYSNLNMLEVKLVFKENNEAIRRQIKQDASAFLEDMEFRFKLGNTTLEDNAILFYLSGYIARSIRKTGKCSSCNNLLIKDGASVSVNFEQMENDENVVSCKKRFFDMVNCGGLCNPSDAIFMATLHAQELFNKIFDDADTRSRFLKFKNPRAVFMECFTEKILSCENTASLGLIKCA